MNAKESAELVSGYLVAGGAEKLQSIFTFLKRAGIKAERNPDVYVREYLSFGIDDARELRERAYTRAVAGDRRVFIVVTPSMTSDAQNALLKTLEEPPAGAVFFLVVPSPNTLLSTLRSRTEVLALAGDITARSYLAVNVKEFMAATPEKRIEMIKPLYAREDDTERDVRGAVAFLASLEKALALKGSTAGVREGIHAIYRARKYLMDKGSLLKPLLEQVALLVPKQ